MSRKETPHTVPAGFRVRSATLDDVDSLTDLWYSSFNPSHKFWDIMTPDEPATRQWWRNTWTMGIKAGPTLLRTFIVEDIAKDNKPVAFSRWNVPQTDGKQDIPLPEYLAQWDADLTEAFWGGMPRNRLAVMGKRPHWSEQTLCRIPVAPCYLTLLRNPSRILRRSLADTEIFSVLEFVGVDRHYQERGLGFTLVNWGCQQADAEGLEVYLDATIKGLPFYKKFFGFQDRQILMIPPRSDTFGTYELMAVVRPARKAASVDLPKTLAAHVTVTELVDFVE